ncbi:MAG TPA: hypothetical protein VEK15_20960 [Vicinamibacteria bacterium]|nr:hypothetical protein [Vicinamibacteria bacterium]
MSLARASRELERLGVLLVTDARLPSLTRIVAGEAVKGSWWSHPKARTIYAVLEALEDDAAALLVKLVSRKLTFVHRALWPELFSVAMARDDWQTRGLSPSATSLLELVDAEKMLRVESGSAKAAREIEDRLLAHGSQQHTERGAHAKVLTTWEETARLRDFRPKPTDPASARAALESRIRSWEGAKLPWEPRRTM